MSNSTTMESTTQSDLKSIIYTPLDLSIKVGSGHEDELDEPEINLDDEDYGNSSPPDITHDKSLSNSVTSEELLSLKLLHDKLTKTMELLLPEQSKKPTTKSSAETPPISDEQKDELKPSQDSNNNLPSHFNAESINTMKLLLNLLNPTDKTTSSNESSFSNISSLITDLINNSTNNNNNNNNNNQTSTDKDPTGKIGFSNYENINNWHEYLLSLYLMNSSFPNPINPKTAHFPSLSLFNSNPIFNNMSQNFPQTPSTTGTSANNNNTPYSLLFQNMLNSFLHQNYPNNPSFIHPSLPLVNSQPPNLSNNNNSSAPSNLANNYPSIFPEFPTKSKKSSNSFGLLKDPNLFYNSLSLSNRNFSGLSKTKLLDSPESFGVSLRGNQKYSIYYQQRPNNIFNNNFLSPNNSSHSSLSLKSNCNNNCKDNYKSHHCHDDKKLSTSDNNNNNNHNNSNSNSPSTSISTSTHLNKIKSLSHVTTSNLQHSYKLPKSFYSTKSNSILQERNNKSVQDPTISQKASSIYSLCNRSPSSLTYSPNGIAYGNSTGSSTGSSTCNNNNNSSVSTTSALNIVNKYKETVFNCSCGEEFENLYSFTLHLKSTHHTPNSSKLERAVPKLVRGQDMWINSETEQTKEILRCMRCHQSFRTLPELTMHMVETNHYSEIVYNDTGKCVFINDAEQRSKIAALAHANSLNSKTIVDLPDIKDEEQEQVVQQLVVKSLKRSLAKDDETIEDNNVIDKKIKLEMEETYSESQLKDLAMKKEPESHCEVLQITEADSRTDDLTPDSESNAEINLTEDIAMNKLSKIGDSVIIRQIEDFVEKSLPKSSGNILSAINQTHSLTGLINTNNNSLSKDDQRHLTTTSKSTDRIPNNTIKLETNRSRESIKSFKEMIDTISSSSCTFNSNSNEENPLSSLQSLVETIQKYPVQANNNINNNSSSNNTFISPTGSNNNSNNNSCSNNQISVNKSSSQNNASSSSIIYDGCISPKFSDSLNQLQALVANTSSIITSASSSASATASSSSLTSTVSAAQVKSANCPSSSSSSSLHNVNNCNNSNNNSNKSFNNNNNNNNNNNSQILDNTKYPHKFPIYPTENNEIPNKSINPQITLFNWYTKLGELLGLPQSLSQAMLTPDAFTELAKSFLQSQPQNCGVSVQSDDNLSHKIKETKSQDFAPQNTENDPLEQLKLLLDSTIQSNIKTNSMVNTTNCGQDSITKTNKNGSPLNNNSSNNNNSNTNVLSKKAKCHFCNKPFANKGQVRLHISKGKCPSLMRSSISESKSAAHLNGNTSSYSLKSDSELLLQRPNSSTQDETPCSSSSSSAATAAFISNQKSVNMIREYFKFAKQMMNSIHDENNQTLANNNVRHHSNSNSDVGTTLID